MYKVRLVCGCCDGELNITKTEASRIHNWMRKNLGSNETIDYVDVHGVNQKLEGVDTFYGIWQEDEEEHDLSFLAKQVQDLFKGKGE